MTVRDRKRVRTRRALVDAATELFGRQGYERTTIAEIADAADVGARTFFSYFESKEELLFPDHEARVRAALECVERRGPDERPAEVLLRAIAEIDGSEDLGGGLAALRLQLMREVPAVLARGLQLCCRAQLEVARGLAAAFPDELDEVTAAALTGAFAGASVQSTIHLLLTAPGLDAVAHRDAVRKATRAALAPWLAPATVTGS
ncbi:TetR/AcrR family transcriptional regulator [Umezawaea tangerina]|uniref:TetR family transcriptional regulator n=1 Tax=Umezawaea tangerina TaxID=84725 RepID=A0A2T0T1Y6_9PSEU|nr:TetR/AcrR family transcriptional regulator [Umezawaea tangerina]PRY39661.1 TetR family transcriptional regulator [Umezawaea tangerina]